MGFRFFSSRIPKGTQMAFACGAARAQEVDMEPDALTPDNRITLELSTMLETIMQILVDKGIITRSEAEAKVEAVRPMVRRALGLE